MLDGQQITRELRIIKYILIIKSMYTTIIHPLRKAYNLSMNEYCVLDTIYHLSKNNKYGGRCVQSQDKIGQVLDLSRKTINKIIKTLLDKGLIEKGETGIRTVDEWNELISNKDKISLSSNDLISIGEIKVGLQGVTKGYSDMGKKVTASCNKRLHNNNIDNNKDNNHLENEIDNLINKWNGLKETDEFWLGTLGKNKVRSILKKIVLNYTKEEIINGVNNYLKEIKDRKDGSYKNHRFTIDEFFTRERGFNKFYNIV